MDHRSDIYSFGVTCYHLLAGEPPFRGHDGVRRGLKHVHAAPRPLAELRPDLPADLCGMVHKMMAKDPADRYQSARDLLRDLARVREGIGLGLTQQGTVLPSASLPSITLTQSGGAAGAEAVPSGPTLALSVAHAPPVRWGRWLLLAAGCAAAAAGGALAYNRLHPLHEAGAAPGTGLPDVRPPARPTTARERELAALLDRRDTTAADRITAAVELGLILTHDAGSTTPTPASRRWAASASAPRSTARPARPAAWGRPSCSPTATSPRPPTGRSRRRWRPRRRAPGPSARFRC